MVEAAPDDEGAVNEALIRMLQEQLFKVLQEFQLDPAKVKIKDLSIAIARISRASVNQKKWMAEARDKAAAVAAKVKNIATKGGLSQEAIDTIETGCARHYQMSASKYFMPYQAAWLNDNSRFKIWEKSRRIGGDLCAGV